MDIERAKQRHRIDDEVQALTAVVRPILRGVLQAIKADVISEAGGYSQAKLKMLPRLYRPGDGDCGICFEYAVHDAVVNRNAAILERIEDALSQHCRITGGAPSSILFGAEKSGAIQLIETAHTILTDDSRLLSGTRGQPVKLKRHIDAVAAAFRRRALQIALPASINGLWKADLFLGSANSDQWVGTTVKINPTLLEGAKGLRVAIVPSQQGVSDAIRRDEARNLVVVPLPYDASFMEVFYQSWQIVKQFIHADAKVPKEVFLPRPADRQVCRYLEDRREYAITEVIEALEPLSQPELLEVDQNATAVDVRTGYSSTTGLVIAPVSIHGRK